MQSGLLAEKYILLGSFLFKLVTAAEKEMALLAIPQICTDKIVMLYHSHSFTEQGVIKTYLTIGDKFFIPDLIYYFRLYIKGCHICQLSRKDKLPTRQLQTRINVNYRPLSRLSMDLKVMTRLNKGQKYILCIIDKVTNYLIVVPIHQSSLGEICNALIDFFKKLNIKIKTVAPYNNQSLQAEH